MKARPIPFSAPMVRALLDGRKSQTRRVVKPQPDQSLDYVRMMFDWNGKAQAEFETPPGYHTPLMYHPLCPYGKPGDLLWVKEAWRAKHWWDDHPPREITDQSPIDYKPYEDGGEWGRARHARFMLRRMSRMTLEITTVRVERLEDISEADAKAEGFSPGWMGDALPETPIGGGFTISSPGTYASSAGHFQAYWCELHGYDAWEASPWVWVLEFKVHQQNVDELLKARAA
ncbi:hypothetical protein J8F10_09315 [Gemmata sp. G18]|uniref:Morphogenetic protein n=1 Tax=Gemmata palustris TaxID=2822762 RepID=A0ABS5BP28_9BACT|nr:hypothetical protein [Gemmata palustris]MBP3955479.1 hypothetical protein [Gemmata palustris]